MQSEQAPHSTRSLLMLLTAGCLSCACSWHLSAKLPLTPVLLTIVIALMFWATLKKNILASQKAWAITMLVIPTLVGMCWMTVRPSPYLYLADLWDPFVIPLYVSFSLILFAAYAFEAKVKGFYLPILILIACGAMLVWSIRNSIPHIDVVTFNVEACKALLEGKNPYAITMPDIYGPGTIYYNPAEVRDGRVQRGFTYPPINILITLPSYVLTGDVRYTFALAMVVAAALIMRIRRDAFGILCGILLLISPYEVFMVTAAWTEPAQLVWLALTVLFVMRKKYVYAGIGLGLFLVSKQYSVFFLPAVYFLLPKPWTGKSSIRFLTATIVTGAVVTLPMVLWDFNAFWHSAVSSVAQFNFRIDSLSYPAFSYADGPPPKKTYAYLFVAIAYLVCLIRLKPSASSFCLCVGVIGVTLFAFNLYAFSNYYYLFAGAFILSAASDFKGAQGEMSGFSAVETPLPDRGVVSA